MLAEQSEKNDEFCIQSENLCIKKRENEKLCIKMMNFAVCYNCNKPGHWKLNCPLLNENLQHMREPIHPYPINAQHDTAGQPYPINAQQSLPSTKTGDSNTMTIRIYARGTGVIGYSRIKGSSNKLAKNSLRMSPHPTSHGLVSSSGILSPTIPPKNESPISALSDHDSHLIKSLEATAERITVEEVSFQWKNP